MPALPSPSEDIGEKTQPGIQMAISDEITREIKVEETDFVIVSYEQPMESDSSKSANATKPPKTYAEQRKSPRYEVRLKVIISNKEKTFLSYTVNASSGGVMLEDMVPKEYFNSDTEIFISSPKKNEFVAFRCSPVGDDSSPKRFSFGQISQASLEKFQKWIEKIK